MNVNRIKEFKRRIQVMCDKIKLIDKVPNDRRARTLFISDDEVGLGDCKMKVTKDEMNEILRFIAGGSKFEKI